MSCGRDRVRIGRRSAGTTRTQTAAEPMEEFGRFSAGDANGAMLQLRNSLRLEPDHEHTTTVRARGLLDSRDGSTISS